MTLDEIRGRVVAVDAEYQDDNEEAHAMEDALMVDVLWAIRDYTLEGCVPAQAAAEVLRTREKQRTRWYA